MVKHEFIKHITLSPENSERLACLCGNLNQNLLLIERYLGVEINNRGNEFEIIGIPLSVDKTCQLIQDLYEQTNTTDSLSSQEIQLTLKALNIEQEPGNKQKTENTFITTTEQIIKPRTANQTHYISALNRYDINFGIGPSGTGKTFLAVAAAIATLEQEKVSRIVLTRPAVEAGEKLGFLPGDLSQKIDPYLRPLYDALYEMLGVQKVTKLIDKGTIEIAPLAYMRGRTLNDSIVILDEGQNTTKEQMKMFLTRIGFGSKAIITGDITQVDLPHKTLSGLRHAASLLPNIDDIHFTFFTAQDVVRHPIVQQIIEAYEHEGT